MRSAKSSSMASSGSSRRRMSTAFSSRYAGRSGSAPVAPLRNEMADKKILGNGHFAMWETNRKEFWEQIHVWIQSKAKA